MQLKSRQYTIAIVGINRECAAVLSSIVETQAAKIIRILNSETEDVAELKKYPQLDIIVNTTNDIEILQRLKKLNLEHVDIISGLSARILFSTGRSGLIASNMTEDKNKLLNSLHEIREAIYLSRNRDELLKLVLNVAIRSSIADSGSIMLLDAKKRTLHIEIADGLNSDIVAMTKQKVGKGIAGTVAKTGNPLLLNGPANRDVYATGPERNDISSSICAPLKIAGEIAGVLCINSKASDRMFSEPDLRYVQNLADFSADIIKAAGEYEKVANVSFSLSLLDNARDIFSLKYSFDERLNLLLLKMVNAYKAEICNYYDYDRDKKVFMAKASSSFNIKLIKGKRLKLNEFFSKQVVVTQKPVMQCIPDGSGFNKKWYIAHPVKLDGSITGLMFLHIISAREEMKEEMSVLEKISEMISQELSKQEEIEAIRVQTVKFSAISEVSFDLASARTVHELGNIIISNASIIMEAESSILRLYNQRTGTLDILDSFSLKSFSHLKQLEETDQAISNDAVANKKAIILKDLDKSQYAAFDLDSKSALCMYLERGGRILGTLSIYDKKTLDLYSVRNFSHKDKEIFLNYCLQASRALDRFVINDSP
jgi:transcriptional regulator with GAF, ATPase, and Fis domain